MRISEATEMIKSYSWNKILFLFRRYNGKNNGKFIQVTNCIGRVRVWTGRFVSFVEVFPLFSFHPFPYKYTQYDEFQRIFCFSGL